jgi:hypothetical protein
MLAGWLAGWLAPTTRRESFSICKNFLTKISTYKQASKQAELQKKEK